MKDLHFVQVLFSDRGSLPQRYVLVWKELRGQPLNTGPHSCLFCLSKFYFCFVLNMTKANKQTKKPRNGRWPQIWIPLFIYFFFLYFLLPLVKLYGRLPSNLHSNYFHIFRRLYTLRQSKHKIWSYEIKIYPIWKFRKVMDNYVNKILSNGVL